MEIGNIVGFFTATILVTSALWLHHLRVMCFFRCVLFTSICLTILGINHCLSAVPIFLVESGQPKSTIVIPVVASPTVNKAANELRVYLEKMSGARIPIVNEGGPINGTRIDVGATQMNRSQLPADFANAPERIWIKTSGQNLSVCGGGDRGTLFAVYRLLEELGCRWWTPDIEFVPHQSRISVEQLAIDTRPAFMWRVFNGKNESWGLKLGLNGFYTAEAAETNGGCLFWPKLARGVHSYYQIIPTETYFSKHPEWYPLLGDKRMPTDLFHQLCVTAPGLADEFASNVIRAIDNDPDVPIISISPNDGMRWCECDACRTLDRKLSGNRMTQLGFNKKRTFVGDRVFWFANEVARRVAKKYPDKKLLVLAYLNYTEPPDTIRPEPNIIPFLCHSAPADYSRPINDPGSEANREFNTFLTRWLKKTPDLMFYSYVSKSMWWRLPRPVLHIFATDIKYLHQLGVRRYYCQSSLRAWDLDGPLYYVIAKLLWDPSANPDTIAHEWIHGMFGPAGTAMEEFYANVERAVTITGKAYSHNPLTQVVGLYDRRYLGQAMTAIEQAEQTADANTIIAKRVATVARTFRYGYWMIEYFNQLKDMEGTGDWTRIPSIEAAGQKALTYRNVPEAAQEIENRFKNIAPMGVYNRGFGTAATKGGRQCWNTDESGPRDQSKGWAEFYFPIADPSHSIVVEMDVWGESQLTNLLINTFDKVWKQIKPQQELSGKPQWDTVRFHVTPDLFSPQRTAQRFGFGGGDRQIWVAEIRIHPGGQVQPPNPSNSK